MKKIIINYGGILLFYLVIVFGFFFLNYDYNYMQRDTNNTIECNK